MHGSKLNQEATISFTQSFTSQIVDNFFSQNEEISGQQIISITPVKQVNFLILKALFDEWQDEIKKFKSPYFDYKNEDVNLALKSLVNTLSKNILIQKEHFQPLLEKAVQSSLVLLYEPDKYYLQLLSHSTSSDKARDLKNTTKYIKLYRPLFDQILDKLTQGLDYQVAIRESVANNTDIDLERQATEVLFNKVMPLNVVERSEASPAEIPMPEPLDTLEDVDDALTNSDSDDMNNEFEPVDEKALAPESVNEKYQEDIKTLNEKYEEEEKSLAAVHEAKSMATLKNNININQRYMFINDLFEGNEKDYELALDEVDGCDSFDSSVELLVQGYAKKYSWDMNADEVKELLKVIFKRFR